MSKCDIRIDFDRADRVYLGGETVSGRVQIQVNQDLNCNGITLAHYWKTHGRGNTDAGERRQLRLGGNRPLLRGEMLSFPFSFPAQCEPVTYRGHYINIDHYVHVNVDVPWAFDPNAEEEYIVRPGKPPPRMSGGPDAMPKRKTKSCARAAAAFVLAAGLLFVAMFFIVLLVPLLLIAALGYGIVRYLIRGRVGKVQLNAPKTLVAPGETWPVELRFTPRKSFAVNGITMKIKAQEAATSGHGTDKTTHRHTVYEEDHSLHPADTLMRGKAVFRQAVIPLPETGAFSFEASDNKIEWTAEVRIDMPGFPDWSEKQTLQMVPREFLHDFPVDRLVTEKG